VRSRPAKSAAPSRTFSTGGACRDEIGLDRARTIMRRGDEIATRQRVARRRRVEWC